MTELQIFAEVTHKHGGEWTVATMTNREKYITKRNEHDMLMHIYNRTRGNLCPLYIISDMMTAEHVARCHRYLNMNEYHRRGCAECIQDWLNKEA